jgi:hypothetical protein
MQLCVQQPGQSLQAAYYSRIIPFMMVAGVSLSLSLPRVAGHPLRGWSTLSPWLASLAAVAAVLAPWKPAQALLLLGQNDYRNLVVSSSFGTGYEGARLVDSDPESAWAIGGNSNTNPQGRDEAWASFNLDQHGYLLDTLFFSPRGASGSVDGVDELQLWVSKVPFLVDVTSKASTDAFLAQQVVPLLHVNGFADAAILPYQYRLNMVFAKYMLLRLTNQTDLRASRNLGAKQLYFKVEFAPGPLPVLGAASGWLWARKLRRRSLLLQRSKAPEL